MALSDVWSGDRALRVLLGLVLSLTFLAVVALPAYGVGNFYYHLDELSHHVRNRDQRAARAELDWVTGFYDLSRRWKVQWFADAYLFGDTFLHQAAASYLTGDYQTVIEDLANRRDDHRAFHLVGLARFRLAQIRYRQIEGDDAAAARARDEIVQEVLDDVNPDFERALRADPGERFDYKWNYDLTSDEESIRRALETVEPVIPPELEQMKGEGTPVRRRRG